jgi:hypothetical protein
VEIRQWKGDPLSLRLVEAKNGLTIPFRAEALSACCSSHSTIRLVVAFRSWEWSLLSKTSISADSLLPSLACIHLPPVGTPNSAVLQLAQITVRAHPTKCHTLIEFQIHLAIDSRRRRGDTSLVVMGSFDTGPILMRDMGNEKSLLSLQSTVGRGLKPTLPLEGVRIHLWFLGGINLRVVRRGTQSCPTSMRLARTE